MSHIALLPLITIFAAIKVNYLHLNFPNWSEKVDDLQ